VPRRSLEQSSAREDVPLDVLLEARPEARTDARLARKVEGPVDVLQECVEVGGKEIPLQHVALACVLALPLGVVVLRERVHAEDLVSAGE
jgi:hypothetical protein